MARSFKDTQQIIGTHQDERDSKLDGQGLENLELEKRPYTCLHTEYGARLIKNDEWHFPVPYQALQAAPEFFTDHAFDTWQRAAIKFNFEMPQHLSLD
ncbi:MAG: hypothetical protein A2711_14595 [Burkholderiales bacterium RIFCSPHIGHO2_01_FULL_63_240]|nr:MAG: hypothetical protein A2711_14595 [Burkholderiales bacterium RIFCSPHIGHO2_01_FULL_63_240]